MKSKYKYFGGFGLLILLNLLISPLTYLLLFGPNASSIAEIIKDQSSIITHITILGLQLLILTLFITQNKLIIITKENIKLTNPLIPFIRKKYQWNDFDYCVILMENSRGGQYEAIWLIKNDRIKVRFSSFYYKNYQRLKREIPIKKTGKFKASQFRQLGAVVFGMKIK